MSCSTPFPWLTCGKKCTYSSIVGNTNTMPTALWQQMHCRNLLRHSKADQQIEEKSVDQTTPDILWRKSDGDNQYKHPWQGGLSQEKTKWNTWDECHLNGISTKRAKIKQPGMLTGYCLSRFGSTRGRLHTCNLGHHRFGCGVHSASGLAVHATQWRWFRRFDKTSKISR